MKDPTGREVSGPNLPLSLGKVGDDWPIYDANDNLVAVVFDDDRREVLMPGTPEHDLARLIVAGANYAPALGRALQDLRAYIAAGEIAHARTKLGLSDEQAVVYADNHSFVKMADRALGDYNAAVPAQYQTVQP